jgi:hypothetical protein
LSWLQAAGRCGCPTDLAAGEGLWIASRFVKWGHAVCLDAADLHPFQRDDGESSVRCVGAFLTL